jgi:4-amino-4-deoxy-L-arabinose transferase-like glycosyltransferase
MHATNGYHPLWLLALLPIAAVVHAPWVFVRAVLGATVVCSALTGAVVFQTMRMVAERWWIAAFGAGIYLLNPQTMLLELDGLETSLCTLLFALLTYLVLRRCRRPSRGHSQSVLLGLVCGLFVLVRTDSVFYVAMCLGLCLVWDVRHGELRRTVIMAAVAAIVVAPWLAWNWLHFHSVLQVSGVAVPYMLHEGYRLGGHSSAQALEVSRDTLHQLIETDLYLYRSCTAMVP